MSALYNEAEPSDNYRMLPVWRLLYEDRIDPEVIGPLIDDAARLPLEERFPLFGLLEPILEHADAALRAAGMRLLAGAHGTLGFRRIVQGLVDVEPAVRREAALALLESARHDPPRLVHGLFHSDPEIRTLLAAADTVEGAEAQYLYLLPDEACAGHVREKLAEATIPKQHLSSLFDFYFGGLLDEELFRRLHSASLVDGGASPAAVEALWKTHDLGTIGLGEVHWLSVQDSTPRTLLQYLLSGAQQRAMSASLLVRIAGELSWEDVQSLASAGDARDSRQVQHILQTARSRQGLVLLHKEPTHDVLDDLLDVFWSAAAYEPTSAEAMAAAAAFFSRVERGEEDFNRRFVAAVIWAAHRHGRWLPGAAGACVALDVSSLRFRSWPADTRREALDGLYAWCEAAPPGESPDVTKALKSHICWDRWSSELDLHAAGAILCLLEEDRFLRAVTNLGATHIIAAAVRDVDRAVPLFSLNDNRLDIRNDLLRGIAKRRRTVHTRLLAGMACRVPAERLDFLEGLEPVSAVSIGIELIGLDASERPLPEDNVVPAIAALAAAIGDHADSLVRFLRRWSEHAAFETSTFGWILFDTIAAVAEPGLLLPALNALPTEVRQRLASRIGADAETKGQPADADVTDVPQQTPAAVSRETVFAVNDLDQLQAWCASQNEDLAEDAALRLIELGEPGLERLVRLLRQTPRAPSVLAVAWTVALWPQGPALEELTRLLGEEAIDAELRFVIGLGLLELGYDGHHAALVDLVCQGADEPWFTDEHWTRLRDASAHEFSLALRLVLSPQPAAHENAVAVLLNAHGREDEVRDALLAALEQNAGKLPLSALKLLHREKCIEPFPLLLRAACEDAGQVPFLFTHREAGLVEASTDAVLTAGPAVAEEEAVLPLLRRCPSLLARAPAYRRLLLDAADDDVRRSVAQTLLAIGGRTAKFRRVADVFAWGVATARALTGKRFRIAMTGTDDLGFMQYRSPIVYVSALPLLRGERNAEEIVKALILHELGHHMFHAGEDFRTADEQSHELKLERLFNLVLDEHLERNLRVINAEYGNKLKMLAAYAFQHLRREMAVDDLLATLGGAALEILTASKLGPARKPGHVVVETGRVLRELERYDSSFARFIRALRMGLGNRFADPRVEEALELFKGDFRNSSAERLLEITKRLQEIFGDETDILESLDQRSALPWAESDVWSAGAGLDDEALQAAIRRILNEDAPRPPLSRPPSGLPRGERSGIKLRDYNRSPEEDFHKIEHVVRLPHDAAAHRGYADQVARPAHRLREYLKSLGLGYESQRFRTSGSRLDRTRLRSLVLRGDPRVMLARRVEYQTDLFLSVIVDCSGSMIGQEIEQAKLFGTLIVEAAKGLPGVDVRNFGFTDSVIYDAGDARRCAVHALEADGGNNDAAALWHAASEAFASRRKAKLLVMISDGSPTECSVTALRGLVRQLTHRMNMVCAQVAVRPLDDICFPNYVLLEESNLDEAVRQFGTTIRRLVQRALR